MKKQSGFKIDSFMNEETERMLFNIKITREQLSKDLVYFKKLEKQYKKDLDVAYKIPNDPTVGQVGEDGVVNENPQYKFDIVSGLQYTYGYINGQINTIKSALELLAISKEDYEAILKKNVEVEAHNKKEMARVRKLLKM